MVAVADIPACDYYLSSRQPMNLPAILLPRGDHPTSARAYVLHPQPGRASRHRAYGRLTAQERAAAELIDVLRLEETTAGSMDVLKDLMQQSESVPPELMDALVAITKEFMRWEDLRPEYIRMYCEIYTEVELMELTAFYKTPVGRKTVDLAPELMKRSMAIRQERMLRHLPELQQRVRARMGGRSLEQLHI